MTVAIVAYIIGALIGLSLSLLFAEHFAEANRKFNADIEFMRSIPSSDDRGQR